MQTYQTTNLKNKKRENSTTKGQSFKDRGFSRSTCVTFPPLIKSDAAAASQNFSMGSIWKIRQSHTGLHS